MSLALIRRRGPGSSAVDFVRTAPPAAFQAVSRFDVVGFDPRGVGSSQPAVDCDEPTEALQLMTPDTVDLPVLLRRAHALARRCQNRDPAFLASLTTANAARDMDVMRAAVGDARLSYLGFSWGGMLGETYATLFPGRARALVLDSPVDADVWLNRPLESVREQDARFEASLQRFFTACAAHQDACGFGGDDPEEAFDALVERLDAAPFDLGDGRSLDGQDVRRLAFESMYAKRLWRPLAAGLVALQSGDAATVRELVGEVFGPGYDLLYDVFSSYTSVEQRWPRHGLARYLRFAEHEFAVAPHFAFGVYESVDHLFWPIRPHGAFYGPYRNPVKATPALVIHSTHDPATPYAWGKRVVRDLGSARLLTFRGDGHGVITQLDPCVVAAFVPYLQDGTLPPVGASRKQDAPFAAAPARAARAAGAASRALRWRAR